VIFDKFLPMWSQYLNVTDRRTDGQRVRWTCRGNSALRVASRGKNNALNIGYSIKIRLSVNNVTNHNAFTQQINRLFMLNRHVFCGMIADKVSNFGDKTFSRCSVYGLYTIVNSGQQEGHAVHEKIPWLTTQRTTLELCETHTQKVYWTSTAYFELQ